MNSFSFDTNKIGYFYKQQYLLFALLRFHLFYSGLFIEKSLEISAVMMKRNNLLHFESVLKSCACTCTARARSYFFHTHMQLMQVNDASCLLQDIFSPNLFLTNKKTKIPHTHTHCCELSLLNSWSRSFLVFVYDIEFEVVKLFSKWCGSVDRHTNVGAKP